VAVAALVPADPVRRVLVVARGPRGQVGVELPLAWVSRRKALLRPGWVQARLAARVCPEGPGWPRVAAGAGARKTANTTPSI
jgi:hypothetical protein